jgi:hypothetical protein
MVLIERSKLFVAWHWPHCGLKVRRPAEAHMTACWIGPFEVTFPDFGYVMPYAAKSPADREGK